MDRLTRPITCLVPIAVAAALPAWAQFTSRQVQFNRPSLFAPSVRLGLIGGVNTRGRFSPLWRTPGASPVGVRGVPGSVARAQSPFNYNFHGRQRFLFRSSARFGVQPPRGLPDALRYTPGAVRTIRLGTLPDARIAATGEGDRRRASGYDLAVSRVLPFGETLLSTPPRLRTLVPLDTGTASDPFSQFFDLRPPAPKKPATQPVQLRPLAWVDGMEREQAQRIEAVAQQALWHFKQAMATQAKNRPVLLTKAVQALRRWRDLDPRDATPCLLLVHVCLARSQPLTAVLNLADAIRREPKRFAKPPELARYFDDPQLLTDQLQSFLLGGVTGPDTAEWWLLRAYCAWMLDDLPRMRDALRNLTDKRREILSREALVLMRNTLEASVARMAASSRGGTQP